MFINLFNFVKKGERIAVATSGGADSIALLHYLNANASALGYTVIALNVEHGIRGESSLRDTAFVKQYCKFNRIPILAYSVDSKKEASEKKLSIEQAARKLRYECFYDAISRGKCDKVATAHHLSDNAESVLFNLFRGSGIRGVSGINENYNDKIIRPLLNVSKDEILEYLKEKGVDYVTDETNFETDYTRNHLRINVIPQIKKAFPEVEKSLLRFSEIAKQEDEFLESLSLSHLKQTSNAIEIPLPCHPALFSRCTINALKKLGLEKDWEKTHVDSVLALCDKPNGKKVDLPKDIVAIKEYDKIVIYKDTESSCSPIPFTVGKSFFAGQNLNVLRVYFPDLKSGLFADLDKIPATAQIRRMEEGDLFTKFGGGTKKLCDYLTDVKVPLRKRETLPIVADGNTVYAIFGIAISDNVKVDKHTKNIVQFIL